LSHFVARSRRFAPRARPLSPTATAAVAATDATYLLADNSPNMAELLYIVTHMVNQGAEKPKSVHWSLEAANAAGRASVSAYAIEPGASLDEFGCMTEVTMGEQPGARQPAPLPLALPALSFSNLFCTYFPHTSVVQSFAEDEVEGANTAAGISMVCASLSSCAARRHCACTLLASMIPLPLALFFFALLLLESSCLLRLLFFQSHGRRRSGVLRNLTPRWVTMCTQSSRVATPTPSSSTTARSALTSSCTAA